MSVTHQNDDLDMAGHHIVDWRYLSDIPSGGATTGQSLVFNGKTWAPATVSGGSGGTVDWADIVGVPATFPPEAHAHVSADISDWPTEFPPATHTHVIADVTDWLTRTLYVRDLDALDGIAVNTGLTAETGVTFYDDSGTGHDLYAATGIGLVSVSNLRVNYTDGGQLSVGATTGRILLGFRIIDSVIGSAYYNGILLDSGIDITGSYGIRTGGNARFGGTLSVNGTGTFNGQVNADGGLRTDTIIEETSAAGVTVDSVLLKDSGVVSSYTGAGASKTNIAATQTIVTSGNDFTSVYKGYDATVNLTAASGTLSTITVRGYDCNITMTNGTPTFFTAQVFPLRCAVDMGGLLMGGYTGNDGPVTIKNSNPNSGQAFGTGYLSVDVYGTTGDVIAAYTRANVTGSAKGIGYRGYATGVSGGTGEVIGVNGYANIVSGAAHTAVMSFDALVFGTAVGIGKRMALRGADHVLIQGGSLILASGTPATPDAVTTTHLTLTAKNSNLYAAGSAEIDGETFMDGNTSCSISAISASANAGTATFIIVDATSAAVTVTLPTASGKAGRMYTIKKIDASANIVTVDGNGAETVDGAADAQLTTQYQVVRVICNGTTWWIV